LNQVEYRISGLEEKVSLLEQSDEEKGKRNTNGRSKISGTLLKDQA
jgi:hypothetical protein